MNIEELIAFEKRKFDRSVETLNQCNGLEDLLSHVTHKTIFCKDVATFYECMTVLHRVSDKHGKYTLSHYYTHGSSGLAICYRFEAGFELMLYCTDGESALEVVSGGRCKFVEKTEVKKSVVCDIGEGK